MKNALVYICSLLVLNVCSLAEEEPRLDAPERVKPQPDEPRVPGIETFSETPVLPPAAQEKLNSETRFGNITVTGSRQVVRGSIASIIDNIRVELNKLTEQTSRKLKIPITVSLYGKEGDKERKRSIASEIVELEGEYQLRLHIHLANGIDLKKLRYHAMELLLYERGLSEGQEVVEGEKILVKPWLILGMLEAIDIKAGKADKKIYQAQLSHLEILSIEKVFDTSESEWQQLEGRQPLAFQGIAGALISALLRQPDADGKANMAGFLAAVATNKGEMENLMRQHFPGMNQSKNSLTKWVILELAELGTAKISDTYSILETETLLENILQLRYSDDQGDPVTVSINDYKAIIELEPKLRVRAIATLRAELIRLSYRCFPLYRPLLVEYESILTEIIAGEDKKLSTRLKNLSDTRKRFVSAGERVRDYLDWYYITQSNEVSGDFKAYMSLSEALQKEAENPDEKDSIQNYLDNVQAIFTGASR